MSAFGRAPSPYHGSTPLPQHASPGGNQAIQPGMITYTTTTDAQGRVTYHPFRAEAASYRTSQGIVNGIQWVPAEATQVLPAGAQLASSDFAAQYGYGRDSDSRSMREWQKDEEKRRRKEEKEAVKRNTAIEKERAARQRAEEKEIRKARERDALRERDADLARERRLSANYGNAGYQAGGQGGYGDQGGDLAGQFGNMGIGAPGMHDRRPSNSAFLPGAPGSGMGTLSPDGQYGGGGMGRPRRLSMSVPPERAGGYGDGYDNTGGTYQAPYGSGANTQGGYGTAYSAGGGMYPPPSPRLGGTGAYPPPSPRLGTMDASGNYPARPQGSPYSRPLNLGGGVYPPGHILEGQPIAPGQQVGQMGMPPGSRSHSPVPGYNPNPNAYSSANIGLGAGYGSNMRAPSPRPGGALVGGGMGGQLGYGQDRRFSEVPPAFVRPINPAMRFTAFDNFKIQDMDDFLDLDDFPRLPPVLKTHDVFPEDWDRFLNDLSMAWRGKLNMQYPAGRVPKKSSVANDILDLWNGAFYLNRQIEIVLYKGREARSGRLAGRPEIRLPRIATEDDDWSSTSSSEDSATDDDDPERYRPYGMYGRQMEDQQRWASEMREARKYRRQRKEEKKRRAKERKLRRKENEKKYTLWAIYVPMREYGSSGSVIGGYGVSGM